MWGIALVAGGQWLWFEYPDTAGPGGIAALIGIAFLVLAMRRLSGVVQDQPPLLSTLNRPVNWSIPKLSFAAAGIGLSLYTGWRALGGGLTVGILYLLWGASAGLTIWGLVPNDAIREWRHSVISGLRREWRMSLGIGALFLVALVIRTAWLDTSPYIQAGDEAAFAIQGVRIVEKYDWHVNPFEYGAWHHPLVYHTLIAAAVKAFGQAVFAARLPSAVLGALTVPAVYLMGRRLFDRHVGLVAALFMVAYPLHVHFSRTGINQVGDPLFAALTVAFLTRALRDGNTMEAALAGLSLGLSQYFYSAARMVPLLVMVYVGLYALVDWRAIRRRAGILVITGTVAGVVVFPNLYAVYRDSERPISPRLDRISIWATGNVEAAADEGRLTAYWTGQIQRSFMTYVQTLDESGFYGYYNPVMGWFAGVPFLVGLAYVARRWRDPRWSILVIWAGMTAVLGGVLLVDPPRFTRYVAVTPGLAVLVALGVIWIARIATGCAAVLGVRRRLAWGFPVALVVMLAMAELGLYVFDYLPQKLLYGEATVQLNEVVDILEEVDEVYQVWYFSSLSLDVTGSDIARYRLGERRGTEFSWEIARWHEVVPPGAHAFVIAPDRYEAIGGTLVYEIPGGEMREYFNMRTGQPLVFIYFATVGEWYDQNSVD